MTSPPPEEVTPFPGAPQFFRRVWDPGPAGVSEGSIGGRRMVTLTPAVPDGGVAIYGYSARSSYSEDRHVEASAWQNGSFPAWCFSEMEPRGEWGFTPLAEVEEITREEFDLAQRRGFR